MNRLTKIHIALNSFRRGCFLGRGEDGYVAPLHGLRRPGSAVLAVSVTFRQLRTLVRRGGGMGRVLAFSFGCRAPRP